MSEYVVGRYYRMPAIRIQPPGWYGVKSGWLPVMGPEHEDKELLDFPQRHFHIDWRFASQQALAAASFGRDLRWVYGFPLCTRTDSMSGAPNPLKLQDLITSVTPVLVRLKCKREWPEYPKSIRWLPELQKAYADKDAASVCPHRGIPASCYIEEPDGVLRCPGHGLAIDAETGKVLP